MLRWILGAAFLAVAIFVFVKAARIQDQTTFYVHIDLGIAFLLAMLVCVFAQADLFLASYLAVFAFTLAINNFLMLAAAVACALFMSWAYYTRFVFEAAEEPH